VTVYQFDDSATTVSILRSNGYPIAASRLADALVVLGVGLFWGLLLYAAISLASI